MPSTNSTRKLTTSSAVTLALNDNLVRPHSTSVVILSIYSAIPLFLAILNLSVFALVRIIRRQIQESNEHLRSKQLFEEAVGTVFVLDRTTTAAEDERPVEPSATDASDETQVDEVSDKDTSAPGAPSRQAQVAIDLGGGAVTTVGSQGETSKRIHRLMVAERELFLVSAVLTRRFVETADRGPSTLSPAAPSQFSCSALASPHCGARSISVVTLATQIGTSRKRFCSCPIGSAASSSPSHTRSVSFGT